MTFDCFGTLIDWRRGIQEHLQGLLEKHGLSISHDVFRTYVDLEAKEEDQAYQSYTNVLRNTALRLSEHLGLEISRAEAENFAASVPLWPPFADTAEALKELGRRGITRVILSNVDRDLLADTISRNGLGVDGYITAQDVKAYKPNRAHWTRFLEEYGTSKESTLHVACSIYHDIVPASGLGFATAWVNRYNETNYQEVEPSYVFRDLKGLLALTD